MNYKDDPEGLRLHQEFDRRFWRLTKQIFEGQERRRAHALAEHPAFADSHREPEIVERRNKYSTMRRLPACARLAWLAKLGVL